MTLDELVRFRIRNARRGLNLSQAQAAELIGVSQHAWATYELGSRSVSLRMIEKIARAFGRPLEYFLLADYEHVVKEPVPKAESPGTRAKKKKVA